MSDQLLARPGSSDTFYSELDSIMSRKAAPEPPPKRGIAEDIATHLAVGANKYLALPVAGITEMAGKATGIKSLEDAGKTFGDNAESWIAQKEQEDPSQKFRDISSVGDAGRWAGEQMLEFVPQAVIGLATGGAGAAAGRVAAGGLARAGITSIEGMAGKKAVQAAVANTGRSLTAKELGILAADRAGTAGAIAATGAGSVAMESSTIYRDQKPEEKDMGRALLYGTAAGILDTAFPAYLMKKTGLTKIMPGMGKVSGEAEALTGKTALTGVQRVKDTVKVAGLGIGEETIQEGVQTVLENIGANKQVYSDEVNKAGGNFSAFLKIAADKGISAAVNPEAWNDIIESMAAGGLIGGVMGGGSSAVGHVSDIMQQRGQQQQTPTEEANALNQQNQPATEVVSGANARAGNILQDSSSIASDSIPESWPVDSGRDLGIAATPPAGAMTRAVNSILPDLPPISADMYSSFAAQPFANAPEAQPDTAVLPSPPNELEKAWTWRKQQTSGHLMQLHGERDASYSSRILSEYRKSQEKANGITSILPEVQGTGPSKVDGQGMAVSKLQSQVAGVGSNNIQPGGVSNDLSSVQQEINGTQKEVSGVRSQTVANRVTALKQEKEQLLTDNSSKGITGGLVYPAEVTQRLGEINAEIQAAESGKAATPPKMAEQVTEQTRYTVPDPKRPQAVPFFDFKIGKAADGKYYANAGYNIAHLGYGGPHPPLTPSGHTKGHNTEREALLAAVSEVRSKVVSATNPQGEKYDTSKYIKELDKFLGGIPPENKTGKTAQPEKPANTRRQLDTTKDSLAVAVAKLGGVSRAEIDKQTGNGKDLARTLNSLATKEAKAGILHVISSKGIPLDRMRESLVEQGYLDDSADINTLLDKLDSASRGTVHRSAHSTEAGTDAYREAEIRYSEMINAMTDEEYDEFSRNQWLDDQVQELADAGDILTEYLDGLDNETMTAADWQEVENDLKEALDATEFSQGNSTEDQGQVQEDATSKAKGVSPVGEGDAASEGTAGASKAVERLPLPGKKEHPRGKAGQKAYEAMLNKYDLWDAPSWDRNDFDKMFYANYHAGWQDHGQPMLDQTQHTETANEAYAAGLVDGVKAEKPQKATKAGTPRTARIKNLQTKLDNGTLLTPQRDELNKLTAIENPPPATIVDVPSGFGDNNSMFTKEKADKARAILRAKLNQLNAGLDPEMITAGIDIAGYYIEGGFRSFKEYSGKIVEDLGEAITPFLKSFYLAVRNYPGFDNKGMDSEADIDGLQKVEKVDKAIAPKILSKHGDKKMRGDYGVADINGYSTAGEKAKSAFLSDAKSYLKEVSQVLKDNGYTPEKINSNPGGTAGSGDVSLLAFKEGSDIGVYVTIGAGTSLPMVSQSPSGIQIMYRATTRKNKYQGLVNRWDAGWDSTTGALAEKMLVEAQKHEPVTTSSNTSDTEKLKAEKRVADYGFKVGDSLEYQGGFNSFIKKGEQVTIISVVDQGNYVNLSNGKQVDSRSLKDNYKNISAKSGIIKPEDQGGGVTNDTTRNGSTSTATLESDQPGSLSGNGDEQGTGSLLGSSSTVNAAGNGHADEGRSDRSGSVASKPRPVHNQDGGTTEGGLQPVIPTPASEPRGLFRSGTNPGNYRITADTHLGEGTRGQKIDNNLAAIRLIKTLDSENRYPTIEEQHILARYVGWGGLKSVFDPTSKQPQDQKARLELEKLMSKEEYFEARQSVLNAHYTGSDIISSIYKVLDHFGFTGGNVMEPTYGSGNFIGLMPGKQSASSKWYGSELDLVTAKIGQYLYPDAQLLQSGFQDAEFPYGKFDLVIGNRPFGGERITDTNKKRSDISGFKIHNYIIAKSAMHLRPGGVMAMVVTSRFMDTADSEARDYLAKQFKFLSAIRLPNDAFAKNAGTEVTTDMVFFQKLMPGENADEQYKGWLKTDVAMTNAAGEEVTVNNWFAKRPEMMLGEPSMKGTMYGGHFRKEEGRGEFTLNARPGQDTVTELEKVIDGDLLAKHKDIFKPTAVKADAAATSIQMNREDIGVGGYFEENDKLFMREDDDEQGNPTFIELTADTQWTEKQSLGETRLNRIKGMMNLRKLAYSLIEAERFDLSDIEAQRRALNKAYDAFVEKHGYISETANSSLMAEDVKIESGLESSFKPAITAARAKVLGGKPKKAHAVKASLLKERVYYPQKDIVTAENARDGYNISLSEKGKLDLLYIAGLTKDTVEGVTEKLANEGLIFRDPETGEWIQEDSYLSGNVKAKLARVDGRDGYEKNIEALKRVLPVDVPTEKIFVDLGATWVPESVYKAFADYLGISNARVMVLPETGSVKIVSSGTVTTNDVNVLMQNEDFGIAELFNAIANKQSVVAYDPPADRNSSRTVNKERTKALGPIVKRMSATFKDWVMADPMQDSLLTKEYNDTQNTHAPRNFNGKYLKTVGASPAVRLRNSQRNAAWRMIQSPVTLLDHVVGAGKTFTVITGIMERKRLGLSNKPMVVVPNHLVGQWAADFLKLYPGANILAATPKDFAAKNRRRLFARIATGNFDAVIVGHSSFGFIPMEPGTQREILMEEISYLERALHQADTAGDKRTVRNIAERIAKKKEKISDLLSRPTDNVITFENMGIDNLTVDESHEFKNLEYSTSMQNITGMGNPKGAKKSFDLYAKIQYLRSKDGAVTFATGTPISNSLVEMYAVLRYLNRPGLKDRKLDVFDSWAKTYALIQPTIEYTASQKLKERQIMNTFDNLTSMLQLYSEFADIISMQDLKRIYAEQIRELNKESGSKESEAFPIPVVKDGGRRLDVGEPTEAQQAYTEYLIARADRLEKLGGKNDPKEDNHLWLMSDARKMALDIRLVDPSAPSDPANKINRSATEIMRIYHDTNSDKGTQLVFCDLSTPAKGAGKEADKFINGALKVLGLDKDKRFMALLSDISYREKWNMISMKLDVEVLQLNESADTDANAARREKLEEFREKIGDEELSVLLTADSGFSVYDELKRTLIEKGIKENEIAFIHDANTQPQKDELFARVNSGDLRVLIGSSKKMGAGMNAQERLVALHHLDAPWRPSDVEQREGRIIRQGNSLYMVNPDGFKVEIIAYSTSRTFDAVMWQILSRKAGMLDDFRSGADSLTEEATDSAGYAEFMAETTGNPIFKEKFNLEKQIDEAESTHRSILARRKASERIVKNAADLLRQDQRDVDSTKRDLDELKDAASFIVNGEEYADDLTDVYNAALNKFKDEFNQYQNVTIPEYAAAVAAIEHQDITKEEQDNLLKQIKRPPAPTKPSLVRLEKTSQAAAAALRISEMLDEIGDRGDVEFSYGAAQIVIAKNTNTVSGGKAGTIDVNYDFDVFINGDKQNELRATGLKHMSEARLLSLFSTGAIRATLARAHSNAKYRMERTAKDIVTAELTLDKLKMPDVSKLEQMRERYKQITEQVNNLEKDMADKRAQGDNQYIAGDRSRFGAGYESETSSPEVKANFKLNNGTTSGIKSEEAQAWVSTLPIAKRVNVVQSISDLPENAQAEITKAQVNPAHVQAMELHGTIHVITDNVPDLQRVKALVVGHELAHAGQTKKVVDLAVDWFKRTVNGKTEAAKEAHLMLERIADRYGYDLTNEKQYRRAVQEATAAIAEQAVNADWKPAGLMQRLFMYIKHWLRQQGLISHVSDIELSLAVAEMLRIGEKRLSVGLGGNEAQFAAAWHGSPHDHNGFSTEYIGEGEGNQAYGWGMYFAGSKSVAEYYKNMLSAQAGPKYFKNGVQLSLMDIRKEYFKSDRIVDGYGGKDKVLDFQETDDGWGWRVKVQAVNADGNPKAGERPRWHSTDPDSVKVEKVLRAAGIETRPSGKLYKVELSPADGEYLLWEAPLSRQSDTVRKALEQWAEESRIETVRDLENREKFWPGQGTIKDLDRIKNMTPAEYLEDLSGEEFTGEDLYKDITETEESDQAASEYLHSLGIRGIKYVNGTNRNSIDQIDKSISNSLAFWQQAVKAGNTEQADRWMERYEENKRKREEAHNYVIFNDADVSIKAKFSLQDQAISQHAAKINAPAKVTDMVKSLIEMAGQSIPERLKANIGKILSNPWFGSEGKPIRRHVVNLNLERSQNRNGIISDLFQASEGYTGVEGLDNILKKASKEELKQFNDLIKHGDENRVATYFTRDELYRGKTKFGKVGKTVVEAYRAFHEVMNAANRVRFQQLDELSMLPYKDQEWFADLVELLNKNMERAAALDAKEASEVHRLIRSLKRNLTDEELASGENPAKIKASPAVIAAYRDFWKQVDQTEKKHQGNMLSAFRDILGYRGELDKLKSEWGNLRGYAPRNRKDGDWHVSVYTTNEEGERVKVYMKPTLTETGAKGLVKEVQADLKKHLKGNFEAGTTYEVEYERNNATPSELLAWKGSEVAVEALLNQAFDRAGVTGKMSVEQWQSLKHEVFQEIAKEIMAQGFGRHGISREANMIEGYDDADYQTVLKEYISGMSGWLSKMRFAIEATSAAKDISKANPSDKVWVNDYVQDAMKNSTYLDELAATARSVGAVYYLGFKVSSALLNAFQNYTVGQAELSLMMKKAGHKGSGIAALAKAQKDVMADFINVKSGGTGTLTKEEHDVLFRAVREGTAQAQAIRQISGTQEMGFGTGWKKFTELSMTPFQFVEQRLNREPAILAAYRIFKKSAAGTVDEAAYKQAETFVNNTHYVMGKENLPEMVRKLGPLGKTAYLFQGYVHNYMHWMFNRAKDGEFATIARSLGAIAALGGVFALPGADDMDNWIMKWFGVSYKMKFKKFVKDAAGNSTPGQIVQNFVNHGVTSVAGVDMSRALAVNIPFISDPEKTFGERIGGAWGGLLKKPGMALNAANKGDYVRTVENLLPEFAANPMRAARQYNQGATTLGGKPIFDETGRQVKYSGTDVAKKMLGFNPMAISDRTNLKSDERDLNAYWKSERDDALAGIRRAKNSEDMKAAVRGVVKYNTELRKSQAFGLVPIIKADSIQRSRTFKPQKKTMAWERNQIE